MKLLHPTLSSEELDHLERLKDKASSAAKIRVENQVALDGMQLPIYSFEFGTGGSKVPTIVFIGGVHGIEVIGTQVVLSFMETLCELLSWDEATHHMLSKMRVLFYPIANPGGMALGTRSNPKGVDLMRNAPIDAADLNPAFIMGGHRLSSMLPWYRGKATDCLELEADTLCNFIRRELWETPFSIVLDVHSGFGAHDRVWFPFASNKKLFPKVAEMMQLKELLDRTFPHHVYHIEPQNSQYRTHGDLWDYLYLQHEKETKAGTFLPLCLEMGSWAWVKKNPGQLISSLGIFNPILPHRQARILRRHHPFLDFLVRATSAYSQWADITDGLRHKLNNQAQSLWYKKTA